MANADNAGLDNRGPYIDASLWTLQAVAGIFLGLRIYCKVFRNRGLWFDDYFLLASWILLAVSASATSANVALGFGRHFDEFDPRNLERYGIYSMLSGFFSILSSVFSKTSFAITLLRLTDGWTKRLIWAIIVSLHILMPFSAAFLFVSCSSPVQVHGKCWSASVAVIYGIVVGSYSAFCDLALALLPWRILLRCRMYRREKIGVALAMSMGIFACATGVAKSAMIPSLGNPDFTYKGAPFVVWGFAECAVSIMAASIPALRVLATEIRGASTFIQRMAPSLRMSGTVPASKRPDNDSCKNTPVSVSPGLDLENGQAPADTRADAPAPAPAPASINGRRSRPPPPPPYGYGFQSSGSAGLSFPSRAASSSHSRTTPASSALPSGVSNEPGLSKARGAVIGTIDMDDTVSEDDIEMHSRRHSYSMQNVS
ncbi:hypothetical protein HMPREF1624_02329 [Sporothrix schenckii ATCC 58251]|uniref:Rhodopsin domain-containing protein n=1 Tax=Sporothrix schenckii (strain ATCC 58251 / de Perez 2211183) TaxID=1391915 RepID=U7Q256_SPOS1|nr:hypothetical protein HMPREF1624_02329 [Sporothrix schenckii ATCC 58251]